MGGAGFGEFLSRAKTYHIARCVAHGDGALAPSAHALLMLPGHLIGIVFSRPSGAAAQVLASRSPMSMCSVSPPHAPGRDENELARVRGSALGGSTPRRLSETGAQLMDCRRSVLPPPPPPTHRHAVLRERLPVLSFGPCLLEVNRGLSCKRPELRRGGRSECRPQTGDRGSEWDEAMGAGAAFVNGADLGRSGAIRAPPNRLSDKHRARGTGLSPNPRPRAPMFGRSFQPPCLLTWGRSPAAL